MKYCPYCGASLVGGAASFGIALANRTTSSAGEDKKALASSNERSEPLTRFFSERKFQLEGGCLFTGCRASDASEKISVRLETLAGNRPL